MTYKHYNVYSVLFKKIQYYENSLMKKAPNNKTITIMFEVYGNMGLTLTKPFFSSTIMRIR